MKPKAVREAKRFYFVPLRGCWTIIKSSEIMCKHYMQVHVLSMGHDIMHTAYIDLYSTLWKRFESRGINQEIDKL